MHEPETSLGGSQDSFPLTTWCSILGEADPASPDRLTRLNGMLSRYWRPVYKYIRASRKKSVEDAKDLAQDFFRHILEGGLVLRYKPELGRFRHFLKGAVRNFLVDAHRDGERIKRGGGRAIFSLDMEGMEPDRFLTDARQQSPEEIFDRQWARDLMRDCVGRLRETLVAEGKELYYRVYEAYQEEGPGGKRPTYDEVAAKFGKSRSDVMNYLNAVRDRLQKLIIDSITDYVTCKAELQQEIEEMKKLFS